MATRTLDTLLSQQELQLLLRMARAARIKRGKKPNAITRWCGPEATSSRRTYQCRICLKIVDTESAKNKPTKHALKAVHAHGKGHLSELGDPAAIPMILELVESPGCKDMSFEEIVNAIRTGVENGTSVQAAENAG